MFFKPSGKHQVRRAVILSLEPSVELPRLGPQGMLLVHAVVVGTPSKLSGWADVPAAYRHSFDKLRVVQLARNVPHVGAFFTVHLVHVFRVAEPRDAAGLVELAERYTQGVTVSTLRDNGGAVLLIQLGVVLSIPSHFPHHLETHQVRIALLLRVLTEHVCRSTTESALMP